MRWFDSSIRFQPEVSMNDLFGGRNTTIDTNPKPVSWNAWWTKYDPPNLTDDLWDLIEETFEGMVRDAD